jgi:hypothetical protein
MRGMWKAVVAALFVLALGLGLVTLFAVEGQEVVVLRTRTPAGEVRRTRIWVAEDDGVVWIEAADPKRKFYADLRADPDAELERGGEIHRYRATPEPGPEGHEKIRNLLRRKYGWADRWVGAIVDTSNSVAIRLDPRS